MYFEQRKQRRSFKWIYLILFVAFIIWVMLDETDKESEDNQVIEIELPR